jgi:flagellar hook-associated protein 2
LNLASAASGTPVTVSVGLDAAGITNALNGFVAAYNQVITDLNQQFAVNSSTGQQGPLGSDSSLQLLQSSLLSDVNYSITGNGGIVNLASLGVSMNDDGTLNVDSSQLNSAVSSNAAAVQNFFQGSSLNGFANNFNTNLAQLTDPVTGLLTADLQQNHAEQTDLTNQISAFQQQLATQKQQLIQEYSQLNASLELYPFLLQSVTEQLDLLNGTTSSTGTTTPTAGSFGSSSSSTSGTLGG